MSVSILQNPPLNKERFKAIVLDLDGTLLRKDKTISPRTHKALKKAQENGFTIILATGRHPFSANLYAEKLGCVDDNALAICYNGAAVVRLKDYAKSNDVVSFPVVDAVYASGERIMQITKLSHKFGLKVHGYSRDRGLLVEDRNPCSEREIIHSHVPFAEIDFENIDPKERFFKILAVGDNDKLDVLRNNLPDFITDEFQVMRSDPNFLEFIPGHSSKGKALLMLCSSMQISPDSCVAFGDAENDLVMIETAGLGVAMGNAVPLLKQQADLVTLSNEEDGVACVVENLV